ncbi:DedA family protein [Frigoriglobus tundricola]|nr:DedA family protein [Frigoriglobus tundricola]
MTTDALYWYLSIFGWLLLTGIGIPPAPEEAGILYAAGVHAVHEDVWWPFAWGACGLGIIAADSFLYGVGRRWGPKLFEYRWVQKVLSTERRRQLEGRFEQHGMKLLLLARFLPPLRTGVFMIAGASRYSFLKFLLADVIYAVVGVGALFFCGTWILALVHRFKSPTAFIIAVLVIGIGLYAYYRSLKKREPKNTPQPPVSVLQGPAGVIVPGEAVTNPIAAPVAQADVKVALEGK